MAVDGESLLSYSFYCQMEVQDDYFGGQIIIEDSSTVTVAPGMVLAEYLGESTFHSGSAQLSATMTRVDLNNSGIFDYVDSVNFSAEE